MSIFQENIQLYSLQKKPEEDQSLGLLKMYKVIGLGKIFKNFSNTTKAITNLSFVIVMDTFVAYLRPVARGFSKFYAKF